MLTMCLVVAPPPPNPIFMRFKWEEDSVWDGMFDYFDCGHLVRMFMIGTVAAC